MKRICVGLSGLNSLVQVESSMPSQTFRKGLASLLARLVGQLLHNARTPS
jgi:hypothetical protein